MKKIFSKNIFFTVFLFIPFYLFLTVTQAYGANNCSNVYTDPAVITPDISKFTYYFVLNSAPTAGTLFTVKADSGGWGDYIASPFTARGNIISGEITSRFTNQFKAGTNHTLTLYRISDQAPGIPINPYPPADKLTLAFCNSISYSIQSPPPPTISPISCVLNASPSSPSMNTPITITGNINSGAGLPPNNFEVSYDGIFTIRDVASHAEIKPKATYTPSDRININYSLGTLQIGNYEVRYTLQKTSSVCTGEAGTGAVCSFDTDDIGSCSLILVIGENRGGITIVPPTITSTPAPTVVPGMPTYTPIPPLPSLAPICDQIDSQYTSQCRYCIEGQQGIWTAIGCLPTSWEGILNNYVFPIGAGIAGGMSFLSFLYGVFLILTSGGNPEKIAEGKEIIISALSGLLLIIFSVFLLRVIGYDILKIPGFG